MKMWALVILYLSLASAARATDWNASVRYWYWQNVSTNVPPTMDIVQMEGNNNATVTIFWKITPSPTQQELIDLEPVAVAFWAEKEKDTKADLNEVSPEVMRAAFVGLAKTVADEMNRSRQWDMALKSAVSNATSLLNLQMRINMLPERPDIIVSNMEAEIRQNIRKALP